jgi:hypothetical protein
MPAVKPATPAPMINTSKLFSGLFMVTPPNIY